MLSSLHHLEFGAEFKASNNLSFNCTHR